MRQFDHEATMPVPARNGAVSSRLALVLNTAIIAAAFLFVSAVILGIVS